MIHVHYSTLLSSENSRLKKRAAARSHVGRSFQTLQVGAGAWSELPVHVPTATRSCVPPLEGNAPSHAPTPSHGGYSVPSRAHPTVLSLVLGVVTACFT